MSSLTTIENTSEIYILDINENISSDKLDEISSFLPEYRIKKSEAFRRRIDMIASKVSFFMLVYSLKVHGIEKLPTVNVDKYGKPFFNDFPLNFNISHCSHGVCCGISYGSIGVDIQDEIRDVSPLLLSVMSECEQKAILAADDPSDEFIKLWCMKESLGKMNGKGICYDLKSIDLSNIKNGSFSHDCFFSFRSFPDYKVCACTEKENTIFIKKELDDYLADIYKSG